MAACPLLPHNLRECKTLNLEKTTSRVLSLLLLIYDLVFFYIFLNLRFGVCRELTLSRVQGENSTAKKLDFLRYPWSLLQVFTYGHCCRDLPTVIVVGIYLRSLLQAFTYSHCCRYLPTVIVAGI